MKPRKLSSNIYQDPLIEKIIVKKLLVGPSTASEIHVSLSIRTVQQYLISLEKEGVVRRVGKIRENRLGKPSTIWALVGQKDPKAIKPKRNYFKRV